MEEVRDTLNAILWKSQYESIYKDKGVKGIENNGVVFKDVTFCEYYIQ